MFCHLETPSRFLNILDNAMLTIKMMTEKAEGDGIQFWRRPVKSLDRSAESDKCNRPRDRTKCSRKNELPIFIFLKLQPPPNFIHCSSSALASFSFFVLNIRTFI